MAYTNEHRDCIHDVRYLMYATYVYRTIPYSKVKDVLADLMLSSVSTNHIRESAGTYVDANVLRGTHIFLATLIDE